MTVHIGAKPGDVAPTVLMPGDPLRAKWAAERYLDNPVLVNEVRGMLGYTGHWRGQPVTIHGSGMGMPSMAIYATELIRDFGAKRVIRVGSAGAMQPHVRLHDIVLAMTASTLSSPSQPIFRELAFAPCADWSLLQAAWAAAQRARLPVHVGGIYTSNSFHDHRPDLEAELVRHGILAVEMETAELYIVAARYRVQALALLTISDDHASGERLDTTERERGFAAMIELALECAFPMVA